MSLGSGDSQGTTPPEQDSQQRQHTCANFSPGTGAIQIMQVAQNAQTEATAFYFDQSKSIDDLFPNTSGLVRQEEIFTVYSTGENQTIKYFENGVRNIVRDVVNQRPNDGAQ